MPHSYKPDIDDTYDKSSDSETTGFASCASSVNSSSTMTNASRSVDLKTLHKTDDQGPCNVTQSPSFSFKENVKTPRNLCNRNRSNNISLCNNKSFGSKKCFVCGSKFHLIRDCDFYENQLRLNNAPVWKNVENIPSFVPRPAYVPTGSRNRPTSVPADRPFPAGWHNPTGRPMTRPKSHYFQQFSRPGSYNQMDMDGGRWGTAVKTSAGCSWQRNRPYMHWGSKNNGGSQQSTGYRISTKGRKTKSNRTKPSTDSKRAESQKSWSKSQQKVNPDKVKKSTKRRKHNLRDQIANSKVVCHGGKLQGLKLKY
ncbi:hypothetical protein Tco_1190093 [Tanacetum coccineum]